MPLLSGKGSLAFSGGKDRHFQGIGKTNRGKALNKPFNKKSPPSLLLSPSGDSRFSPFFGGNLFRRGDFLFILFPFILFPPEKCVFRAFSSVFRAFWSTFCANSGVFARFWGINCTFSGVLHRYGLGEECAPDPCIYGPAATLVCQSSRACMVRCTTLVFQPNRACMAEVTYLCGRIEITAPPQSITHALSCACVFRGS